MSYKEIKNGRKTLCYVVTKEGDETTILCPLHVLQIPDQAPKYLLYSNEGKLIYGVYWYLNSYLRDEQGCAENTIYQAAEALRFLFFFLAIHNIHTPFLSDKEWNLLKSFLEESRGRSTLDVYLSTYRQFLRELNLRVPNEAGRKRGGSHEATRPKEISDEDYARLWDLAYSRKDYTSMLIMHLMRVYGIRKGFCLSLTIEDLSTTVINGEVWGVLHFGNRLTAGKEERVKGKINPNSKKDYQKQIFQQEYSGTRKLITLDSYNFIMAYIEYTHEKAIARNAKKYYAESADNITSNLDEGDNHSVFLNKKGTSLKGRTVSDTFHNYFEVLGLPVSHGNKRYNTTHSIRHAFAMEQIRRGNDSLKVSRMMGHNSPFSIQDYYNPSDEEIAEETRKAVEYTNTRLPNIANAINEILNSKKTD